jgi:hypothetical protein
MVTSSGEPAIGVGKTKPGGRMPTMSKASAPSGSERPTIASLPPNRSRQARNESMAARAPASSFAPAKTRPRWARTPRTWK